MNAADLAEGIKTRDRWIERVTREREEWRGNFLALEQAVVGDTGLSAIISAPLFRARAKVADDLLAALTAILNSDMAMREEDEGRVSPELAMARAAISKATPA